MTETLVAPFPRRAPTWRTVLKKSLDDLDTAIAERKQVSATDPVADGMLAAKRLIERDIAALSDPSAWCTASDFAAAQTPPVSRQTVHNWIRAGRIAAGDVQGTGRGLLVRVTATVLPA